ncbi:MAG: TIGR03560 family F420-dependent LLM class oxidoreductase [Actinomycetota bacterium]
MRVCLMVEGQEDVGWEHWLALAAACEDAGIEALFRSDHYLSVFGAADRGSLDAWATINALAAVTRRLRLGTMVSPATFRHPSVLAKMVATADHVSGGRVELGIGAGWHEPEHVAFGFPFPQVGTRMEVLAEQLEVVHGSWGPGPFSFHGRHYTLEGLDAHPKPVQQPHPPVIVGGHGGPASARLAARWADEYNTVYVDPGECRQRRARVERAFEGAGRDPAGLTFSLMTGCLVGIDEGEVRFRANRVRERTSRDWTGGDTSHLVVGTVDAAVARLRAFEEAGVDRVMLQHLLHEDLGMVRLIGQEIAPAVR